MTVNLSRLDRLILSTIALCLVYLCLSDSADSAQAQKKVIPMPVKIIGDFKLTVPVDGLPVDVQNPVAIDAPVAGVPVRIIPPKSSVEP